MSGYQILGLFLFCVGTLSVGVICLGRPTAVRDYALRTTPKWNPFRNWMESSSYIWSVRLSGVVALLMFLLVLYVCIRGK